MNVDELQSLASEWGHLFYGLTFLWTFFEGETFVIFAGLAARLGEFRGELHQYAG